LPRNDYRSDRGERRGSGRERRERGSRDREGLGEKHTEIGGLDREDHDHLGCRSRRPLGADGQKALALGIGLRLEEVVNGMGGLPGGDRDEQYRREGCQDLQETG
jgi:hypothetical protein